MADTDAAPGTTGAPKKAAKKATKPKTPASHPKYSDMVNAAIKSLKERGGSSRQAILKYIMANYKLGNDVKPVNAHLRMALKRGVASGALKQAKGTGASGSFRVADKADKPKKVAAKKPKAAKPKKAAAKKSAKPKAAAKKPAAKKSAKPKAAKKSPAKKAAKPKAAKKPASPKPKKATKPKATKKASPKKAKGKGKK